MSRYTCQYTRKMAQDAQHAQKIKDFINQYQEMPLKTQLLVETYLHVMFEKGVEAEQPTDKKKADVTFSYPARGDANDGNPALMAILELVPDKKLVVKENEYSRQRAIWLCEDFTVSWSPSKSHLVLEEALGKIYEIKKKNV